MAKLEYLVIHCADTPQGRDVTPDDIELWHLGAKHNSDGTITYLGKKYKSIGELRFHKLILPSGKEVPVRFTNGRGWRQRGYADLIDIRGKLINLTPYDFDGVISPSELTNGASGYNSNSRHVVLPGGKFTDGTNPNQLYHVEELFPPAIQNALVDYIRMQREMVPNIKVIGHNEISGKLCPGFDVQEFLKDNKL